jgi:hypothetical protein
MHAVLLLVCMYDKVDSFVKDVVENRYPTQVLLNSMHENIRVVLV